MSSHAPDIGPSVVLMGYKLPIPLKIALAVGIPIWMLPAWSALFDTHQYEVAALCFFLGGGLLLFLYTNNSGYRIAWDDERVYMRDWGFRNILFQRKPFKPIAFHDIKSIEGRFGPNALTKSRFMPFEYLEIASCRPGEEDIWIYPLSLNQQDLEDFLVHLHGKRPEIFPDAVLEMIGITVPSMKTPN